MNNPQESFQYDSCISRGICSISPKTSALVVVLILFLRLTAKYCLKLKEKEKINDSVKKLILNSIAIAVSNYELTENSFIFAINEFKKFLPDIIGKCNSYFEEDDFKHEEITSSVLFLETENITSAVKLGEKIIRNIINETSCDTRNLYQTVLVLAKSLSINLMDLESYGQEDEKTFVTVIELLNLLDKPVNKDFIIQASKVDNELMEKIRNIQEERYGVQNNSEVSYTTYPGKAVLVAGSNIRELETILEALKNNDIDVYTHDDMMLAHTFPKFSEYKALKGQFGQGEENCLIDFATFPGPIILTKHSLHNLENLYRGRLFTTDYTQPKGVINIKNNDFSAVISSALNSKGFKRGKHCETVNIGYDKNKVFQTIEDKMNSEIKRIILIGLDKHILKQKPYFEKIIKNTDNTTLIISFSYNYEKENLIYINSCYDNYSLLRIYNHVRKYKLPVTIFMPKCDRNTISQMIYLSSLEKTYVYAGKCTPILINPSLIKTLKETFGIRSISTAKQDLGDISKF